MIHPKPEENYMKKFGIDISKWQGDFNLESAVTEGVSFVIIKGGGNDNGLYTDSKFEANYAKAKKLNIPVGVYWFSKALSENEAVKEAEYLYSEILSGKQFELPVYIDVEHEDMLSLGKDKLTSVIDKWCSLLERKGFWVGIYSSVYSFRNHMNDEYLKKYTHWVAQWAKECTYNDKSVLGMWQFGGETNLIRNTAVAGVVCDQNYMYKDFPTLIKQNNLNGFSNETHTSANEKKSYETIACEVLNGKWGNGNERKHNLTKAGYNYYAVQSLVNDKLNKTKVKAGDLVKMTPDGVIYGTDKKFAGFVYNTLLYVRELKDNRAVISIQPEGAVTGAVDVKYLIKHKI